MTTSRQREQNFWHFLRKYIKTQNRVDFQRVENRVSNSMPDVYFSSDENNGVTGWLELKVLHPTHKNKTLCYSAPHFSEGQRRWIHREWLRGARPFLLVEVVEGPLSQIYLLSAEAAKEPFPWTGDVFYKHALFHCQKDQFRNHDTFMLFLDVLVGRWEVTIEA